MITENYKKRYNFNGFDKRPMYKMVFVLETIETKKGWSATKYALGSCAGSLSKIIFTPV